jgi:hypothetical protein
MRIYVGKPPKPGGPERFTMGALTWTPTTEQLKKMGFERPLRRLAKALVKSESVSDAIGIEVQGILFNFMLDPKKD